MSAESAATDLPQRPTRSVALELARLHLRTGALALARTELETLAGRDLLDDPGILDLAEARWRTGDLAGAGEAVAVLLEGSGDPPDLSDAGTPLAWVIAAEAAAGRGRPTEARRHADQVRSIPAATIDALFAGLPRSTAWPVDPLAVAPVDATLFPTAGAGGSRRPGQPGSTAAVAATGQAGTPQAAAPVIGSAPGFWDAEDPSHTDDASTDEPPEVDPELAAVAEAIAATEADADITRLGEADAYEAERRGAAHLLGAGADEPDLEDDDDLDGPDPGLALVEGRRALADGRLADAALQLGLVVRLAPVLAPDVLAALADTDAPELAFVRGDAYRLVGREREARRAYGRARPRSSIPSPDPRSDAEPASAADAATVPDPDPTQGDSA